MPGTPCLAVELLSMVTRISRAAIRSPRTGFQIPSAIKPVQTTIKPTTITARKLEEVKSSRMTTPMPQSGKAPATAIKASVRFRMSSSD
jgi:hypothetical protein